MQSAAEYIDAVQRLARVRQARLTPAGEFPPGWSAWFAQMGERLGAITGAAPGAIAAVMAQRPLQPAPPRAADLTRWQAFRSLWQQDWRPVAPDERRWHWGALAFTTLWHAFFGAMLLWLMYLQYLRPAPAREGEQIVQVQYVGRGAPREPGAGTDAPAAGAALPADASPSAPAASQSAQAPPREAASAKAEQAQASPDATPPEPTPTPAPQPVAVSEPVPQAPEVEFVLPPPRPREFDATPSNATVTPREVATRDVPEPLAPAAPRLPRATPAPATRDLPIPVREVAVRDVPQPIARPTLPTVAPRTPAPPVPALAPADIARRDVPMRPAPASPAPARSASATPAAPSPAPAQAAAKSTSDAARATASATAPSAARPGTGRGPKPGAAPGSTPTARTGEDWADAARNRDGGQRGVPGLYNADGTVRLAGPPGSASAHPPPGSLTQEIKQLDRAGTWRKRRPNDYEPTAFDSVWVPHETLLQEWVRKGIKQVSIPIPGSSKRITCVVSLLALGGACDVTDPNLNDQPAVARPPPDIPFKPALQEDNGSVRKPPGG